MATQFQFVFNAREIGALGIWQRFCVTVEADDEESARLKLYDKYEHISVQSVRQIDLASDNSEKEA